MSNSGDQDEQLRLYNRDEYPFGSCPELFQDIQIERNRFVVMAKLKSSKDSELFAHAHSETEVRLDHEGTSKKFRFHKVFSPMEDNNVVYDYLSYMTSSVLEGEDCGIIAYGGKDSGKSHLLMGNDRNIGLIELYIRELQNSINIRQMNGYLSMSLVSVDEVDVPRDLLHEEGPTVWKMKFTRERYDSSFRNIYKAELLDTSGLTRQPIEDANEAISLLKHLMDNRNKNKIVNHILTIYFDGEDDYLASHGRITFVELIPCELMKKAGTVDKLKSCFHDIMKSFFEQKLVSYQQAYLTYILRDVICLGVRTALISTIDPGLKRLNSTTRTISFVADLSLTYDLGNPVKRVLSKQYEVDHIILTRFLTELEGQNKALQHELYNCLKGPDSEKRIKSKLYAEEVYLKRKNWKSKSRKLEEEIIKLELEIKSLKEKYETTENERESYEQKTKRLEEEIARKKLAMKGDPNYIPLKMELDKISRECEQLLQKKQEYESISTSLAGKLDEFRHQYPHFNENKKILRRRKVNSRRV